MLTHLARAQADGSIRKEKDVVLFQNAAPGSRLWLRPWHKPTPVYPYFQFQATNQFSLEAMSQGLSGERPYDAKAIPQACGCYPGVSCDRSHRNADQFTPTQINIC